MLWDLIRDFFVQHVFGGTDSIGDSFECRIGTFYNSDLETTTGFSEDLMIPIGNMIDKGTDKSIQYISFGDWLSTTATAIAITIIVVLCCMFVYKIVKLIGGLIR